MQQTNYHRDLVRLCHTQDLDMFLTLDKKSQRFTGTYGYLPQSFIEMVKHLTNGSFSILFNQGFGHRINNTNEFTGCIGHLQRNESDVILYPADYPFDASNIQQGLVMYEVKFAFVQSFLPRETYDDEFQIFNSLHIYREIWMHLIAIVLIITLVYWIRNQCITRDYSKISKQYKRKKYELFYVMSHCYRFGSIPDDKLFDKVIFIALSLFSLYVVHYYLSLIKTSLVVVKANDLLRSYQDIMDKNIPPYFIKGLNAEWYFEFAPENSKRNKLWKWIKSNFQYDQVIIDANLNNFLEYAIKQMFGETVLIVDEIMAQTVVLAACKFKGRDSNAVASSITTMFSEFNLDRNELEKRLQKTLALQLSDSSEKPFLKGLIFNQAFDSTIAREIKKKCIYFIENGLPVQNAKIVAATDMLGSLLNDIPSMKVDITKRHLIDECLTGEKIHHHKIEIINIKRLKKLCIVVSSLCIFSTILLMIEYEKYFIAQLFNGFV